jgi:hypothetical protein
MPETITQALLANGPIGLVALVATYSAWKLALKVDDLQERRVTDVEKVIACVAGITDPGHAVEFHPQWAEPPRIPVL